MSRAISRILLIGFFGVLLTSGFPNFMMQEAHAAVPDMASASTATTTTVTVNFNNGPVFNEGGTGTSYISCFRIGGNTVTAGTDIGTTEGAGANSITLTTTAFGTGDTPDVVYTTANCVGGSIIAASDGVIDGNGDNMVDETQTTTDGVAPTLDSAIVTSATTIEVTFSEAINSGSVATTDFTVTNPTTSISSVSVSGSVVTLNLGASLTDTATPTITIVSDIDDNNTGTNNINSGSVVATSGFTTPVKGGGSGCDGDCLEPTLGVIPNGQRVVDDGFTYNGHSVDVERFFTPYPLITANVGKTNVANFKIYEDKGPDNIRHFSFAFGLDKDDIIADSKARIELDRAFDGTETVTVFDPENSLDNIKVTTSTVSCSDDSVTLCLGVEIQHMFRTPLDFNIVATDVWDTSRQSWQNYYNHGIEVIGESLNPPKEYNGVNQGHIYHLTETSKTTAVDEFGDSWTFQYGKWNKDFIKQERIQDEATDVFTRMHSEFGAYKEDNVDKAFGQLLELCPTCIEEFTDLEDAKSYDYTKASSNKLDRLDIKYKMIWEENKAQKIMNQIMDSKFYIREAYFGNQ